MPTDFPSREVYRGHDGVRKWRAEIFDQDLIEEVRVEMDDLVEAADGETVVMAVRLFAHSKRLEPAALRASAMYRYPGVSKPARNRAEDREPGTSDSAGRGR